MTFTRKQTIILLLLATLFFGFTLLQASWLADKPTGKPKLIADHAVDPVRDTAGCIASANSGYGSVVVGPDVSALQGAVGAGADAIRVTTEIADGVLVVVRQFRSDCAADKARARSTLAEAATGMTKPQLFWQIKGADQTAMLLSELSAAPGALDRSVVIGDDAAVVAIRTAQPKTWAFSIPGAQACASDYRLSGMWGSVPASCQNGFMLLTLDDLGYTLWGWPNRFLARMQNAGVRVIIAEDVLDGQIKGLSDVNQYGDIANSYNSYIWVDNITDLGPALRR
jgi:glycerophosphoryl diester phosphodiesterase